jgi:transposase
MVRAGAAWRLLPHALPPSYTVSPLSQRGLNAGGFAAVVPDLHTVWRLAQGRKAESAAAICDSRTRQATPESGTRAGYDGAKRRQGPQAIGRWIPGTLGWLSTSPRPTRLHSSFGTVVSLLRVLGHLAISRIYLRRYIPETHPQGRREILTPFSAMTTPSSE